MMVDGGDQRQIGGVGVIGGQGIRQQGGVGTQTQRQPVHAGAEGVLPRRGCLADGQIDQRIDMREEGRDSGIGDRGDLECMVVRRRFRPVGIDPVDIKCIQLAADDRPPLADLVVGGFGARPAVKRPAGAGLGHRAEGQAAVGLALAVRAGRGPFIAVVCIAGISGIGHIRRRVIATGYVDADILDAAEIIVVILELDFEDLEHSLVIGDSVGTTCAVLVAVQNIFPCPVHIQEKRAVFPLDPDFDIFFAGQLRAAIAIVGHVVRPVVGAGVSGGLAVHPDLDCLVIVLVGSRPAAGDVSHLGIAGVDHPGRHRAVGRPDVHHAHPATRPLRLRGRNGSSCRQSAVLVPRQAGVEGCEIGQDLQNRLVVMTENLDGQLARFGVPIRAHRIGGAIIDKDPEMILGTVLTALDLLDLVRIRDIEPAMPVRTGHGRDRQIERAVLALNGNTLVIIEFVQRPLLRGTADSITADTVPAFHRRFAIASLQLEGRNLTIRVGIGKGPETIGAKGGRITQPRRRAGRARLYQRRRYRHPARHCCR